MRDYLSLGSAPVEEECVQVDPQDPAYLEWMKEECKKFLALLRAKFGREPDGARLAVKIFEHDFGPYAEVVCWFDDENPASIDYAFAIEANLPASWNDSEKVDWASLSKVERE